MKKLILSIAVVILFEDCSDDSNVVRQTLGTGLHHPELKITTCVFSFKSSMFKETFSGGSSMGVYVLPDEAPSSRRPGCQYKNLRADAIRQTDRRIRWQCESPIPLCRRPIRVYAYYPYRPTASQDTASVPVRIAADARFTPDFRFGTLTRGHKPINKNSPVAMLSLTPGLALLSFRLSATHDSLKTFNLESIQVGNCAGSSRFCQQGKVNIVDGKISGLPGSPGATLLRLSPAKQLASSSMESLTLRVLPLSHPLNEKEIEVIFKINGRSYASHFPGGTCWKNGYEYLYSFSFDGEQVCLKKTIQLFS